MGLHFHGSAHLLVSHLMHERTNKTKLDFTWMPQEPYVSVKAIILESSVHLAQTGLSDFCASPWGEEDLSSSSGNFSFSVWNIQQLGEVFYFHANVRRSCSSQ
jgi:hypothetical protein